MHSNRYQGMLLGLFISLGLMVGAYLISSSIIQFKEYERVVTVKGLAEEEVAADVAVWPIRFISASNSLNSVYEVMDDSANALQKFLLAAGFSQAEISSTAPLVTDKLAERYGNQNVSLRYSAMQTFTIYTNKVDLVRQTQRDLAELGKQGVVFSGDEYSQRISYMFTGLNDLKPQLIEQATQNARVAAQQFAQDSNSKVGKLRRASQGQISISDRDDNTPYIKKVRVVSTLEYYLVD